MSGVYIKQELSSPDECSQSNRMSPDTPGPGPVSVCTVPVPPTQRVMPRGLGLLLTQDNITDTDKVKKFLVTLITFSEGISASSGAKVRRLVDNLVLGSVSVPEFLRQLQLVTTFPVRPFVLPFLQSHLPRLAEEMAR